MTYRQSEKPFSPEFVTNSQPEPKTAVKTLKLLSARYNYLVSGKSKEKKKGGSNSNEEMGEWTNVMEEEYYDFVLFEIPKVEF